MVFSQHSKQIPFGWSSNSSAYKEKKNVVNRTLVIAQWLYEQKINKPETKNDRPMFQQF